MATVFGPPPTVSRPDLFPRSAEQSAVLGQLAAGALWTDPDFPPTDASLVGAGRPRPRGFADVAAWLRPDEFAPLPPGEAHALVLGGAAAGDVVQGALGDCYFLGALSAVAASHDVRRRSRLLQLVLPADGRSHEDPPEGGASGLYTFRFYVFGEWVQVTVDTLVPCGPDRRPVFARCRDPRELWCIYLEKAYAKLHGSYLGIEGGSLASALVDLTGGFAEEIDLRSPAARSELRDGRLWKRLVRYQRLGYLMGCAISAPGGETQAVSAHNLMHNHAYGVLLHYEQGAEDEAGGPPRTAGADEAAGGSDEEAREPLRLVKVRNPWGRGEWSGRWADGSAEWRTEHGARAARELAYTPEEDGTFFVGFEDYAAAMNTLYVCKVLPEGTEGGWHRSMVEGSWSAAEGSAGGCFSFSSWRANPQWLLRVPTASHAHFVMLQPDPRRAGGGGTRGVRNASGHRGAGGADGLSSPGGSAAAGGGPLPAIGLYLMRGHDTFLRRVLVDSDELEGEEVADSTDFAPRREVSCNTLDEPNEPPLAPGQPYVLVPSTFAPGVDGRFRLVVYTRAPPSALAPIPPLLLIAKAGAWAGLSAGGPRGCASWRHNPQFLLRARSGRPTRISIVLRRAEPTHAAGAAGAAGAGAAGPRVARRKGLARGAEPAAAEEAAARGAEAAARARIGFLVAHADDAHPSRRALRVPTADVVDSAAHAPHAEVGCEFYLKEAGDFVLVPSTSEPGVALGFCVSVYSDEPVELTPVDEWRTAEAAGEWRGRAAAGCRNSRAWVANPTYALRVLPGKTGELRGGADGGAVVCHAFLSRGAAGDGRGAPESAVGARRQEGRGSRELEGIGLYMLPALDARAAEPRELGGAGPDGGAAGGAGEADGAGGRGASGLQTSGFYRAEEVGGRFALQAGRGYYLIPSTYRRGAQDTFRLQLFASAPLELRRLPPDEHAALADGEERAHAAETVQRAWARRQMRRSLSRDRPAARALARAWFARPRRAAAGSDEEGYRDLSYALDALEAAYIGLSGKPEAHGRFFGRARAELRARGVSVADYDRLLPGPQE